MGCSDITFDLPGQIVHIPIETPMLHWTHALPACDSISMVADHFESVSSVGKNVLGVTEFSSELVEVLLVGEAYFEVLVRVWYCNLLVLQTA